MGVRPVLGRLVRLMLSWCIKSWLSVDPCDKIGCTMSCHQNDVVWLLLTWFDCRSGHDVRVCCLQHANFPVFLRDTGPFALLIKWSKCTALLRWLQGNYTSDLVYDIRHKRNATYKLTAACERFDGTLYRRLLDEVKASVKLQTRLKLTSQNVWR